MLLDTILPRWHHRERHSLRVPAPSDVVLAAVESVTWRDLPLFRTFAAVSPFGRTPPNDDTPFLERMTSGGFRVLRRDANEIVVGAVAPVLRKAPPAQLDPSPLDRFHDFREPGYYRVAFNFHHADGLLTTETRVQVVDEGSRRAFSRYWLLIRFPSGLIRREWLLAIRRAAAKRAPGTPNHREGRR